MTLPPADNLILAEIRRRAADILVTPDRRLSHKLDKLDKAWRKG